MKSEIMLQRSFVSLITIVFGFTLNSCFDDTPFLRNKAERQKMLQCIKLPEDHDQKLSFIHSLRTSNYIVNDEVIYLLLPRSECAK